MARTRTAGNPDPEPSFEQAMNELDELVRSLEDGTLPLDSLVDRYERGSGLLQLCRRHLDAAQQRIELITRKADGTPALEAVSGESAAPAPAAPAPKPAPAPRSKAPSPDHANSDEIRLFQL